MACFYMTKKFDLSEHLPHCRTLKTFEQNFLTYYEYILASVDRKNHVYHTLWPINLGTFTKLCPYFVCMYVCVSTCMLIKKFLFIANKNLKKMALFN